MIRSQTRMKTFPFLLGILWVATGYSHPVETLYFCRDQEIPVRMDSTGVVFQVQDPNSKSIAQIESVLDASAETLYANPEKGRYAYRNPEGNLLSNASSKITSGVQVFPLYTSLDGKGDAIGFDEIIVRLKKDVPSVEIDRLCLAHDLQIVSQSVYEPEIFMLRPANPTGQTCFELALELQDHPQLVWVTPNLYSEKLTAPAPNDPHFVDQVHHSVIDTLGAWGVTAGSSNIRVAVIDGGVDLSHEDLAANVWINPVEAGGQVGVDDDGNGYIDDINGWDFFGNDNDPSPAQFASDDAGHGSAVTGLIAANQNNGVGVSGVAPDVRFISCKGFDNGISTGNMQLSEAIRYAANMADIMNNSWATDVDLPNEAILDAIDYAVLQGRGGLGCLPIWAAGNGDGDRTAHYGSYPWTVGVSLTDYSDIHNDLTSFDETIQIAAPIGQWSTDAGGTFGFNDPENDYVGIFAGSSSAAPIVTGVGALILSRSPGLTASEVAMTLLNSADNPIPGIADNDFYGKSPTLGYGRVNAHRAASLGSDYINDRLEPNDSVADAAEIKSGYYTWLHLPEGDVDIFKAKGSSGALIKCSLEWLNDWGQMDMVILSPSQQVLATSTITLQAHVSRSDITYVPANNDTLYLKVFSQSGPGKAYALRAQVGKQDDAFEPNNSLQQPSSLNPGLGTSYKELVLNDDDYYRVPMTTGQFLYGLVTFNYAKVDIGIEVYNPSGQQVPGINPNSETYGDQFQPFQATTTGDYVVRVYGGNGGLGREYSLHLAVLNFGPLSAQGSDDLFEDNDTFPTATVLSEGFYPNLALDNQGGEVFDAYTFVVPPGKVARMTMGWLAPGVDIDMLTYPEEVISMPPGSVPPIGKSSRKAVAIESITLPVQPVAATFYTEIVRISNSHQPYRLALEFLDPEPCEIVSMWRFNEGNVGNICDPVAIRDWRGPRMSNAPQPVSSAPTWVAGPDPSFFPGSDGIALQFVSGGLRFPGNGDLGELALGDRDFTVWTRVLPTDNSSKRVIATVPGAWEFCVRGDNSLDMIVGGGAGTPAFNGTGPLVTPGTWQDVAMVWNRSSGQVRLFTANGVTTDQTSAAIPGVIPLVGEFHIGSDAGGSNSLGSVEQLRLFNEALSISDIQLFSVGFIPSSIVRWELYN